MTAQSRGTVIATLAAPQEVSRQDISPPDVKRNGVFEGYASVFGKTDLGRDIVAAGAFRVSLARRGPSDVRMLFQHDPALPIGVWERIYEDARGLFVRGRLSLDSPKAREVHALMRDRAIDGLSIGFRAVKGARDPRTGVRRLTEIDLWEISVVTFPMLLEARVDTVKSTRRPLPHDVSARLDEAIELIGCTRRRWRPQNCNSLSTRTSTHA